MTTGGTGGMQIAPEQIKIWLVLRYGPRVFDYNLFIMEDVARLLKDKVPGDVNIRNEFDLRRLLDETEDKADVVTSLSYFFAKTDKSVIDNFLIELKKKPVWKDYNISQFIVDAFIQMKDDNNFIKNQMYRTLLNLGNDLQQWINDLPNGAKKTKLKKYVEAFDRNSFKKSQAFFFNADERSARTYSEKDYGLIVLLGIGILQEWSNIHENDPNDNKLFNLFDLYSSSRTLWDEKMFNIRRYKETTTRKNKKESEIKESKRAKTSTEAAAANSLSSIVANASSSIPVGSSAAEGADFVVASIGDVQEGFNISQENAPTRSSSLLDLTIGNNRTQRVIKTNSIFDINSFNNDPLDLTSCEYNSLEYIDVGNPDEQFNIAKTVQGSPVSPYGNDQDQSSSDGSSNRMEYPLLLSPNLFNLYPQKDYFNDEEQKLQESMTNFGGRARISRTIQPKKVIPTTNRLSVAWHLWYKKGRSLSTIYAMYFDPVTARKGGALPDFDPMPMRFCQAMALAMGFIAVCKKRMLAALGVGYERYSLRELIAIWKGEMVQSSHLIQKRLDRVEHYLRDNRFDLELIQQTQNPNPSEEQRRAYCTAKSLQEPLTE